MNFKEIQELIKLVSKVGVSEVELEKENFKIKIRVEQKCLNPQIPKVTNVPSQQIQTEQQIIPNEIETKKEEKAIEEKIGEDNTQYVTIKSPMIGTFYRRPAPEKPPFVEVGDIVKKGQVLCIIEAMKLFNEIESEVSGKIIKILVDDSSPVEYDQPLFLIDPQ